MTPELMHVEIPRSALCVGVGLQTGRVNRPEGHTPHTFQRSTTRSVRCKHCHRRLEWNPRYHVHVSVYRIKEEKDLWQ